VKHANPMEICMDGAIGAVVKCAKENTFIRKRRKKKNKSR